MPKNERDPALPVHVVTGVTGDIPRAWAREHEVGIVPAVITFGEEQIIDDENYSMEAFVKKLKESAELNIYPKTAACGPEYFKPFYEYQGPIISVHAGDNLSVFWANSVLAAKELKRHNIHPYNTLSVSLGEGFLAMRAAELAEQGAGMEDITRELNALRPRVHVAAICDSLTYLKNSGRVSGAQAFLGNMLSVKPSIHAYDNEVVPLHQERTRKKAVAELATWVHGFAPLERLAVIHTGNMEYAMDLAEALKDECALDKMLITLVTKTIVAHTGPDTVGVAFVKEVKKLGT
jgi:DegV family protein with EDD domain